MGRDRLTSVGEMQRLTNIFSALNFIDDDDADLTPEPNPRSANRKLSSQQSLPAKDGSADKRDCSATYDLQKPLVWIDLEMTGNYLLPSLVLSLTLSMTLSFSMTISPRQKDHDQLR